MDLKEMGGKSFSDDKDFTIVTVECVSRSIHLPKLS